MFSKILSYFKKPTTQKDDIKPVKSTSSYVSEREQQKTRELDTALEAVQSPVLSINGGPRQATKKAL